MKKKLLLAQLTTVALSTMVNVQSLAKEASAGELREETLAYLKDAVIPSADRFDNLRMCPISCAVSCAISCAGSTISLGQPNCI